MAADSPACSGGAIAAATARSVELPHASHDRRAWLTDSSAGGRGLSASSSHRIHIARHRGCCHCAVRPECGHAASGWRSCACARAAGPRPAPSVAAVRTSSLWPSSPLAHISQRVPAQPSSLRLAGLAAGPRVRIRPRAAGSFSRRGFSRFLALCINTSTHAGTFLECVKMACFPGPRLRRAGDGGGSAGPALLTCRTSCA